MTLQTDTRLTVRLAQGGEDLGDIQRLRGLCFRGQHGGLDADAYDPPSNHAVVEVDGKPVAGCRLRVFSKGAPLSGAYSARFFDLGDLGDLVAKPGPMVEVGRLCVDPDWRDARVLRMILGALVRFVDDAGASFLFGCTSFPGTCPAQFSHAMAHLVRRARATVCVGPSIGLKSVSAASPDRRLALSQLPPLLRTYLSLGVWVSDRLVVDHDLGTMLVLTGLDVGAIPSARRRSLRVLGTL